MQSNLADPNVGPIASPAMTKAPLAEAGKRASQDISSTVQKTGSSAHDEPTGAGVGVGAGAGAGAGAGVGVGASPPPPPQP
jgi:hypothetical protein